MPPSEAWKERSHSDRKYQEIPSHCRKFMPPGAFEGGRQFSDRRPRGINYATYGKYVKCCKEIPTAVLR